MEVENNSPLDKETMIPMPHEEDEEIQHQPRSPDTVVDWKHSDDDEDDNIDDDKTVILTKSQSSCDEAANTDKTTFVAPNLVGTDEDSTAFDGADKQTNSYAPSTTNLPTNHHPSLGTGRDLPDGLRNEKEQNGWVLGDAMTALTLLSSVAAADAKDESRNNKDQEDSNTSNISGMATFSTFDAEDKDIATVSSASSSSNSGDVTRSADNSRSLMEAEDSDAISALTMLATQAAPLASPCSSHDDGTKPEGDGRSSAEGPEKHDEDHYELLNKPFWSLTLEEEMKVMSLLGKGDYPTHGSSLLFDAAAKMTDESDFKASCALVAGKEVDYNCATQADSQRGDAVSSPPETCLNAGTKAKRKSAAVNPTSETVGKLKPKKRRQNSTFDKQIDGRATNARTAGLPIKVSSSLSPPVSTVTRGEDTCLTSSGSQRRLMEAFASHEASTSLATSALLSMAGGQRQLPPTIAHQASTFAAANGGVVSLVAASRAAAAAATVPVRVNTVAITPPPPPLPSIPQPPNQHHLTNPHSPSTHFTTTNASEDWRKPPPPIAPKMKRPHKKKDLGYPVEKEKRGGPIQIITRDEIRDQDVLAGRGGQSIHHCGNRIFRHLVNDKLAIYARSSKQEKTRLATSIVMVIKDRGGRFLRKIDASGRKRGRKRNSRVQVSDDDDDDEEADFDSGSNFPSSSFPKKKTYRSSTDTMYEVLPWLKARYKVSQRFREALSHPNEGLDGV